MEHSISPTLPVRTPRGTFRLLGGPWLVPRHRPRPDIVLLHGRPLGRPLGGLGRPLGRPGCLRPGVGLSGRVQGGLGAGPGLGGGGLQVVLVMAGVGEVLLSTADIEI